MFEVRSLWIESTASRLSSAKLVCLGNVFSDWLTKVTVHHKNIGQYEALIKINIQRIQLRRGGRVV